MYLTQNWLNALTRYFCSSNKPLQDRTFTVEHSGWDDECTTTNRAVGSRPPAALLTHSYTNTESTKQIPNPRLQIQICGKNDESWTLPLFFLLISQKQRSDKKCQAVVAKLGNFLKGFVLESQMQAGYKPSPGLWRRQAAQCVTPWRQRESRNDSLFS